MYTSGLVLTVVYKPLLYFGSTQFISSCSLALERSHPSKISSRIGSARYPILLTSFQRVSLSCWLVIQRPKVRSKVASIFLRHSSHFPGCIESSIHILH